MERITDFMVNSLLAAFCGLGIVICVVGAVALIASLLGMFQ